ncbi:MAG: pitrilysin family protein [Gemmatimonadales bacterium]|jgi:zinc protease
MTGGKVIDRSRRPESGPAPKVSLPTFSRFSLTNGLSVLAVRHDDIPEVSARLVFNSGAAEDDRGQAGTALLTARALTEGTRGRPAPGVAEWLDYLGARFSVDVDYDASVISLHFLSRVFDGALEFLAETIAEPAFEAKEVARLRDERLDEIASGLDESRIVASLRVNEATFGSHPYGMRVGGVAETVREIDGSHLNMFHSRFYRPSGATLVIVGDLPELDALRSGLESAFASWQGEVEQVRQLEEPEPPAGSVLWAVNWAGPQSEIRVGGVGISRADPDYAAVLVMNSILGGLFSSRINMNLREDKGWTYGASSRFDARKRSGPYLVSTAVDARATIPAVREILGELGRMKSEPATDEELELAVNALTLSLPRTFETVGQVSGRIAQQVIYELSDDYWDQFAQEIRAVTRGDVERVADRFLSDDRIAIVVVGPVEEYRDQLGEFAAVEMRDIQGHRLAG